MNTIDAHQHFWDPSGGDYGWLSGRFEPINRPFAPEDLRPALARNDVDGTVLVQTLNSLDETWAFLRTAEATEFVAGVVGWVDLADPNVGETLRALQTSPEGRWLVGIRHLVHDEPDADWLLRDDVRRGLAEVEKAGLVYDLLTRMRELPAALRTVKDFPGLRFVVDHISKPDIAGRQLDDWAALMDEFRAERGHVWCKLSGMVTEADWQTWTPADLEPYVARMLDVFGAERCMFGTDWPVCLVAGQYDEVVGALRQCLAGRTEAERSQVFGRSAIEAYRLPGLR